ncbi:MAG: 50S ribosomal protein L30 [Clostridia bacterium]|nr:50S ribosomal protein L30 [Clostridia bacterium]
MAENKIKITLVKSTIGALQYHKDTVAALGLKKIGQSVVKEDNASVQGMIARVAHLVKAERV